MTKARLLYANVVAASGTTIAASSAATGYPATNVLSTKRALPWRSASSTGNQTFQVDFASAQTVKAIALVNYLIHAGGSVKAEYWDGAAWQLFGGGTGLFTIPASNRTKLVVLWYPTGQSTTKIRITFTNTAAVNSYVELGVLYVAATAGYFAATVNLTDDFGYEPVDPSVMRKTEGGQDLTWVRPKYLTFSTSFQWQAAADKDTFLAIFDNVGKSTPIIIAADADNLDQTIYGTFDRLPTRHLKRDQWSLPIPFREAL